MIMMGNDRKKALTAILGPESDAVGIRGDEMSGGETGHAIAAELIDAFHAKDHEGVWEALKAAFQHLDSDDAGPGAA